MKEKYDCNKKCPELDYKNLPHCKCNNPKTVFEEYPDCCPVGNIPEWELIDSTEGGDGE